MNDTTLTGLDLYANDASGQRRFEIRNFPSGAKIRELIGALIPKMGLSSKDSSGRPLDYQVFSIRESCHLRGNEIVGENLQHGDEISLLPDVQAGSPG